VKKYLLWLLLSPLCAMGQQKPGNDNFTLSLGLSLNNTVTGVATTDQYSNRPTSFFIFPEFHVLGDLAFSKNNDLRLRLEATATFIQANYTLHGDNGYSAYMSAYKVNETAIAINPQLLYLFSNANNHKFYAAAGVSISGISAGNNNTRTQSIQGGPYYLSGTDFDLISWYSFAATLSGGYSINDKFDIFINFTKPFAVLGGSFLDFGVYSPAETSDQYIFKIGVNYRMPKRSDKKQRRP
jgi:hypothetical protein